MGFGYAGPMNRLQSWYRWLECHWVAPAYGGGVLLGLTIAFLGAATNTMAGWLYVISGVVLALLLMGAWLPPRSLKGLRLQRDPIRPVSVGEPLRVTIRLHNPSRQGRSLLQLQDPLPPALGPAATTAIATLAPRSQHPWRYERIARQRGIYHWAAVQLRTAAPVGLFWCQRSLSAPASVTIYPQIWPLQRCSILDHLRLDTGLRWQRSRLADQATEGLTRALRPYRWGDPSRLIHWRTSARYGELRIRELEQLTADNQVLLALDVSPGWRADDFEAAIPPPSSLDGDGQPLSLWSATPPRDLSVDGPYRPTASPKSGPDCPRRRHAPSRPPSRPFSPARVALAQPPALPPRHPRGGLVTVGPGGPYRAGIGLFGDGGRSPLGGAATGRALGAGYPLRTCLGGEP